MPARFRRGVAVGVASAVAVFGAGRPDMGGKYIFPVIHDYGFSHRGADINSRKRHKQPSYFFSCLQRLGERADLRFPLRL